jgi:DNA-binding response OmpR family regulator
VTNTRHTALLVEDEPDVAHDVEDMLRSMGHAFHHASTQEEALHLLGTTTFCYVLQDLTIPVSAESISARVEAGQNFLEEARRRFPTTNEKGIHYLPIIVMSGHAREDRYIIRAYEAGASGFIVKPFSANETPFATKIKTTLEKSGRAKHQDCALMTEHAAGAKPAASAAPSAKVDLVVSARVEGRRCGVHINQRELLLTNTSFRLVATLAVARVSGKGDGWVHKGDLGDTGEAGFKNMSRLRQELAPALPKGVEMVENDKGGNYRLGSDVEVSRIDWDALAKHSDHRVKKLAGGTGR